MEEIWKNVLGYDGLYEVSNLGRVKSVRTGKYMKTEPVGDIMIHIGLSWNGTHKRMPLGRIVADAFIPNPKGMIRVAYLDGDKYNNKAENLKWSTSYEYDQKPKPEKSRCAYSVKRFIENTEHFGKVFLSDLKVEYLKFCKDNKVKSVNLMCFRKSMSELGVEYKKSIREGKRVAAGYLFSEQNNN